jgi:uncharacterized OsmC-like protein
VSPPAHTGRAKEARAVKPGSVHGATVRHLGDDRFAIEVRGHAFTVDQPIADGGTDTAPTPTELFVAGLASCVGFYARRYLARHQLATAGLKIDAVWSMGRAPTRVDQVDIRIGLPTEVPVEHRQRLLAFAEHCTVHNSLREPPTVNVAWTETAEEFGAA